jgi:large subunit ribosomal protein L13
MTAMKTFSPKPSDIERRWYVVDADGAVLGRLASDVARILRGKHKPIFAPHVDTGDHVIVVNARGIRLTGGKLESKVYYHHSGYPGGLREVGYARLLSERPVLAVEKAIRGMLPKNRLGRAMARKLAVYEGPDHPHQAQMPQVLQLGDVPKWEGLPKPKPEPVPAAAPKRAKTSVKSTRKSTVKSSPARGRGSTGGTRRGAKKAAPAGPSEAKGGGAARRRGGAETQAETKKASGGEKSRRPSRKKES